MDMPPRNNGKTRMTLLPTILSLEQYSHVWIIFVFHLNNNIQSNSYAPKKQWKETDVSSSQQSNHHDTKNGSRFVLDGQKGQQMSKIAPPALGGEKVGIFSTRKPHRPNPIGMTLCQIDSISLSPKTSKMEEGVYQVHVNGLNLVDGTPVLDIKPYIPHYDSIGYRKDDDDVDDTINSNHTPIESIQIPEWVQQGLVKRRSVKWSHKAQQQLEEIMNPNNPSAKLMNFYGVHTGRDLSTDDAIHNLQYCIQEVLSVDVRSQYQTKKARTGNSKAERADRMKEVHQSATPTNTDKQTNTNQENTDRRICIQQLDNLLIKYTVRAGVLSVEENTSSYAINTEGSGADDFIEIEEIEPISSI